MSDEQVRAAERRWRETRSDDDARALVAALRRVSGSEGDLLARCVRVGVTSAEGLEVASFLDHAGARALLPSRARLLFDAAEVADVFHLSDSGVRGWARRGCPVVRRGRRLLFDLTATLRWREADVGAGGLGYATLAILVRACGEWDIRAGARAALALLRLTGESPHAVAAAERWVVSATREAALEVGRAAERDGPHAGLLAFALQGDRATAPPLALAALNALARTGLLPDVAADETLERLRGVVREAVVPWALFRDDPLARTLV